MNQCDSCEHWKSYKDYEGKEHFSCKKLGSRSTSKWKQGKCSEFKLKEHQEVLFTDA